MVGCSDNIEQFLSHKPTPFLSTKRATSSGEEVKISTHVSYYRITGNSADELRSDLNKKGHVDQSGNRWDAYTEWYITWSYPYSITDDGCATGPIMVDVDVKFYFPKWSKSGDATQELVDKWNDYINALETHEDGHKEIAINAGCDIWQVLNDQPHYANCDELERNADEAANEILDLYRQRELSYDKETDHGATQGARFP